MKNGLLDRALVLAIFAALGGQFWQMFSISEDMSAMEVRLSGDIAELSEQHSRDIAELKVEIAAAETRLSGNIAEVEERLARIETLLQYIVPYIVPNPADLPPDAEL